jgi:hypothetical protein
MMFRSTSSNLAGTSRTLVAVGTVRLASMLETILAETPRSGSGTVAVLTVAVDVALVDAGVVAGATSTTDGVGTKAAVTAGLGVLTGVAAAVDEVATGATDPALAVATATWAAGG